MATRQLIVMLQNNNLWQAVVGKIDDVEQAHRALATAKQAAVTELELTAREDPRGVDPNIVQNIRTMIESPTTHIAEMQRRTAHPKYNIEYLARLGQQRDPTTGERSQGFHDMLSKMRAEAKPKLMGVVISERYINMYLNQQHVDNNVHLCAAFRRYHGVAQTNHPTTTHVGQAPSHNNVHRKQTQNAKHPEDKTQHSAKRTKLSPNTLAMITEDICNIFDNQHNAVGFTNGSSLQQTVITLWVVMVIRCIAAIPPNVFLPHKNTQI